MGVMSPVLTGGTRCCWGLHRTFREHQKNKPQRGNGLETCLLPAVVRGPGSQDVTAVREFHYQWHTFRCTAHCLMWHHLLKGPAGAAGDRTECGSRRTVGP